MALRLSPKANWFRRQPTSHWVDHGPPLCKGTTTLISALQNFIVMIAIFHKEKLNMLGWDYMSLISLAKSTCAITNEGHLIKCRNIMVYVLCIDCESNPNFKQFPKQMKSRPYAEHFMIEKREGIILFVKTMI